MKATWAHHGTRAWFPLNFSIHLAASPHDVCWPPGQREGCPVGCWVGTKTKAVPNQPGKEECKCFQTKYPAVLLENKHTVLLCERAKESRNQTGRQKGSQQPRGDKELGCLASLRIKQNPVGLIPPSPAASAAESHCRQRGEALEPHSKL